MNTRATASITTAIATTVLAAALPGSVTGQRRFMVSYNIEDGLAQSQPRAILQAESGYLWIGTTGGGVSRFDGHTFTTYTTREGLGSSLVYSLAEDSTGTLWAATDNGISRFDGLRFAPLDLPTGPVTSWVACADGGTRVWFATDDRGLIAYDRGRTRVYTTANGLPDNTVRALLRDSRGVMWIGTRAGLCRGDREPFTCFTTEQGLLTDRGTALAEDTEGRLWIGSEDGATIYEDGAFSTAPYAALTGVSIETLMADSSGSMWIGTRTGLLRLVGGVVVPYTDQQPLGKSNILSLYRDREGIVWIGTDSGGLVKFPPSPFVLFDADHGLPDVVTWPSPRIRRGTSGSEPTWVA